MDDGAWSAVPEDLERTQAGHEALWASRFGVRSLLLVFQCPDDTLCRLDYSL